MDPFRFSALAHGDLALWNPLEDGQVARAIAALPAGATTVLDIGCGRAEVLARVLEARPAARGVGVDPSPFAIERARANLAARGLAERVTLRETKFDATDFERTTFDVVLCVGATHALADNLAAALVALRPLARPGGILVVGDGYWRREPDPAYLEFLGASAADYRDHGGNVAAAAEAGLSLVLAVETSLAGWDRYEGAYAANMHAYLAAHPDDPDAEAMRRRIDRWRDAYHRYGRDTLGFGLYVLKS
jgi:SAM-dependent methyltransferase